MKNKKLVFYTIYKQDKTNNDIIPINQFDNINQLQQYLQVPTQTLYNRIHDKKLILNKYIIYKDYIDISI